MHGVRVLVLEDCALMAEALELMLLEAGADGVDLSLTVAHALDVIGVQPINLACLDIVLGNEDCMAVADELVLRGIPFVFVTAHGAARLPTRHGHQPLVNKFDVPAKLIAACVAAVRAGEVVQRDGRGGVHR
jgi:DNA-binding NtrC family response regulator